MKDSNGLVNFLTFRSEQAVRRDLVSETEIKITESQILLAKGVQELIRLTGLAAIFANADCAVVLSIFLSSFDKPESPTVEWAEALLHRTMEANASIIRIARSDFGITAPADDRIAPNA